MDGAAPGAGATSDGCPNRIMTLQGLFYSLSEFPKTRLGTTIAIGDLLLACHGVCEQETVPEGTTFTLTVTSPSTDCPEIVPLKAGDTLTLRAGKIWTEGGDGICTGNSSTGAPPEFPQYPASPFKLGECSMGPLGLGFECRATAPDCAMGDVAGSGHVNGGPTLSRFPKRGETMSTELVLSVAAGADASCRASCLTKIPATIEML